MKARRTVQVFDVEEWPICEYCGMPVEPNELDWHKHQERWLLRQREEAETAGTRTGNEDSHELVTRVYVAAEVMEPTKA